MGRLLVRRRVGEAASQGYYYRLDTGFLTSNVAPFRKTLNNVVSGIKERILYIDSAGTERPPCHRRWEDCAKDAEAIARKVLEPTRLTRAEFISTRPGRTRALYEKANADLEMRPRSLEALARTSLFIKWERTVHIPGKRSVPRIINPRSPEYNILLGRYLLPNEHKLFAAMQEHYVSPEPVIAKGLTQEEKARVIVRYLSEGYYAVGLDASRFDQCIGEQLLRMEHHVYHSLFPNDRLLRELLKCQLDNSGVHYGRDGVVKIRYGAIRCSGDMNTSLGNCIISTVLANKYCSENAINDFRTFCDGDDLLLFVKRPDLGKLSSLSDWYLQWGLRMKIEEPQNVPERVEFCQSRPVMCCGRYRLIRNPIKCLNSDYSGYVDLGRVDYFLAYLRAVGVCGKYMAAGCPVLQEWYSFGVREGRTGRIGWTDYKRGFMLQSELERKRGAVYHADVDALSRRSFFLAFGIDEGTQMTIEGILRELRVKQSGHVVNNIPELSQLSSSFAFLLNSVAD